MTCGFLRKVGSSSKPKYRYEVRALDGAGAPFTVGWTDDSKGGALVTMVEKHPSWHSPRVVDLEAPKSAGPENT
jgi:hypothetical protein